ncbi:MAG: bacillithiol biosynthesis deacetylase BshB1 [Flavobacteriales bacterium]
MKNTQKINLLAFAAHPDDVELAASGTMLKHKALGYSTGIVDLTRGELGTRGSAELRDLEAADSAKILNLDVRENLAFADGFFEIDEQHLLEIIKRIRFYQPDLMLVNAVSDRHPDHGRGSELVSRAAFLAGLRKIKTNFKGIEQTPWRPKAVYHYIQYQELKPDILVDISEHIDQKMESILAFKSQFFDPSSNEPETPISSKQFIETVKNRSSELGKYIGVAHAEGFTVERYVGTNNLFDLL